MPTTETNQALLVAVMEAMEDAGMPPVSLSTATALTAALAAKFPGMAKHVRPGGELRAHWKRWTPEEEADLVRRYHAGESRDQIAQALGRSPGALNGAITRLALTRDPAGPRLVEAQG